MSLGAPVYRLQSTVRQVSLCRTQLADGVVFDVFLKFSHHASDQNGVSDVVVAA